MGKKLLQLSGFLLYKQNLDGKLNYTRERIHLPGACLTAQVRSTRYTFTLANVFCREYKEIASDRRGGFYEILRDRK
jgi:hypothetical protein